MTSLSPPGMPLEARAEPRPRSAAGVVVSGLASAALFAPVLVHPGFLFLAVSAGFPLSVQALRQGLGSGVLAALFATGTLAGVFSPGQTSGYVLLFAVPALLVAEALSRGRGLRRGALWAFGFVACVMGVFLLVASDRVREGVLAPLDAAQAPAVLAQLRESGWSAEMVDQWIGQARLTRDVLAVVYPAAMVILGGLLVLANVALLRFYLARRDPGWLDGTEFEGLRLPLATALVFVLAGASVVFPPVREAGYNVLLVLAFFFALQGLAVVAFYARRLAAPPVLRAAVVLLVVANPWAPQILALMGLFDIWLDLRKYAEPPAEAGQP